MKLLFFIYSLEAGGAERVTSSLANYWAHKDWSISIVTITGCDNDFYPLEPSIKRIGLSLDNESKNLLQAVRNNIRIVYETRKVLNDLQPDIAVSMMTTANILLAIASIGVKYTKFIGSERIHPPFFYVGKFFQWSRKYCYGVLDAIVVLTEETATWIEKNTNAKQLFVIPNALTYPMPAATHHSEQKPIYLHNKMNIIAVGRLDKQKGFDRLIQVCSVVLPIFPNWHVTILGEGCERKYLQSLISKYGLQDRVTMPGTVGNISQWYHAADLYVLTSLFEGFPNTLIEAMAHGLPVVSVDCDTGPRDIVRDKVDGLLVKQGDSNALMLAVSDLMSNENKRKLYGLRATEIRERLSIEKISAKWQAVFEEVMR